MPPSPGATTDAVVANIRAELADRRMPQARVAEALGISQQSLNDRLRGRTPLTVPQLLVIAELLDLPVTALTDERSHQAVPA